MKAWLVFLLVLFSAIGKGQQVEWKLAYSLPLKMTQCKLDQINNIYCVKNGELIKYDSFGKELSRFSDKLIGDDVHIDVTNPMKVLVYSPDQMTLITLDSRLGEMNERINFFKEGFEQITLAATSHSNGMWVYDPINFQIIRLGERLAEDRRSLNLAQLLRVKLFPTDLIEINNRVFLTDPEHGVFLFDVFGNYIKKIPILGVEHLMVSDDRLFFIEGGSLKAMRVKDSSIEEVEVRLKHTAFISINRNRISSVAPSQINIYQAIR
ncbi:MAG: hypothetical protein Salg2KO_18280 [Salibacteraceae bacterium]